MIFCVLLVSSFGLRVIKVSVWLVCIIVSGVVFVCVFRLEGIFSVIIGVGWWFVWWMSVVMGLCGVLCRLVLSRLLIISEILLGYGMVVVWIMLLVLSYVFCVVCVFFGSGLLFFIVSSVICCFVVCVRCVMIYLLLLLLLCL